MAASAPPATFSVPSSNDEWVAALKGPRRDRALAALRERLVRGLRAALAQRAPGSTIDTLVEDFVQEALLKILDNLDSFRGESRFTTWAQKIAVRVALSELRRKRWQDVALSDLTGSDDGSSDYTPTVLSDHDLNPEEQTSQSMIVAQVEQVIAEDLSERQRQALTGVVIQGMPVEVVAERLGSNRNALYKLIFDARKRLRKGLEDRGLTPEGILDEL
ncbi:MAG: sigma-70 family RNA polymerase sigma factor [Bacteroidota bacterium]